MPSPTRRSARGPSKPLPSHSNSSTSSLSSARHDRTVKSGTANNQKSATPRSQSSEETSEPPRRSQRAQPAKGDDGSHDLANVEDGTADEEETTRCICGHQDYPGPPLSEVFSGVDAHSEDAGGLFIQCDGCTVWQHGGCVGIVEESQSPDKYYCEECKPKQHELHTDSRGQKYSNYLPLYPKTNRKGSVSKSEEKNKRDHDASVSRASADPVTGRRRGTVRSKEHDDEEEQLRRAIEESKREVDGPGTGRRAGKRSRDDAEDAKPDIKRQRTMSESHTLATQTALPDDESDDELNGGGPTSKGKKAKGDPTQTARQRQLHEKDKERERARAEAAGRRQERAGRRRADESDPAEETPKPGASARTSPPPSSLPPSPPGFAVPDKASHKKGAGKKMKKLGNNQYTKNRDLSSQPQMSSPHSKKRQLANFNHGPDSGEEQGGVNGADPKTSPGAHENGNGRGPGKGTKGKGKGGLNGHLRPEEPVERTFVNMKRSMDGMMAFMQRHQIEMAGDRTPPGSESSLQSRRNTVLSDSSLAVQPPADTPTSAPAHDDKPFNELSSMEMADELARNITKWHTLYGQYA